MKNLFNVSPFILLLVPFFVAMILTVTINPERTVQGAEVAAKTTINKSGALASTDIITSK